ncbi:MAG: FecR domain-containing protein, partial [Burkholderiales bacterium]
MAALASLDTLRRTSTLLLMLAAACLAPPRAFADATAPAGRVIATVGDVRVVDRHGIVREATQGGEVREGEVIKTGTNALGQLRLADGTLLSVRAGSVLKIEKFSYAGEHDTKASAFISLAVGGFRWLTGLIGKVNRDGVRVTTPNATIGIRGTDFEPVFVPAAAPGEPGAAGAGAYVRVYAGEVSIRNLQGIAQSVLPNQVAFAAIGGTPPVLLRAIPTRIYPTPTPLPKLAPQGKGDGDTAAGEA